MSVPTQEQRGAEARALILSKDIVVQQINEILEDGLSLHQWLWDKSKEAEVQEILKDEVKTRHLEKRLASFAMFFNRIMPAKALILHGRIQDRRITPEMLEAEGLSVEVIRRLAGIEVTQEEARDVTPENGKS